MSPGAAGSIRVRGEASQQVAPDSVVIHVEFRGDEKSISKSRTAIEDQVKTLRAWLNRLGIDAAKDVSAGRLTPGHRSGNVLSYNSSGAGPSTLEKTATVTVHDLTRYEEVLMLLLESGAGQVKRVTERSKRFSAVLEAASQSASTPARPSASTPVLRECEAAG